MRRPVLLFTAGLGALASLLLLVPDCASACSCGAPAGTPQEVVDYALSRSETVFAGEVVDVSETASRPSVAAPEGTVKVAFRVSEVWKGRARETVEATTDAEPGISCGFPFEEGQKYLVYASEGMEASACSETKAFPVAGRDLEVLGAGEKPESGYTSPKPEGDDNLPETGGESPGLLYPIPGGPVGVAAVLAVAAVAGATLSWRFSRRS